MAQKIFLASPLGPGHQTPVRVAVEEAVARLNATRDDQLEIVGPHFSPGLPVIDQIRSALQESDLLLADVSNLSPNILWEIGFAQALGKPVVVMVSDDTEVPFDLRAQPFIAYRGTSMTHMVSRIEDALRSRFGQKGDKPKTMKMKSPAPTVYISYSHRDREYLERILVHLRPLERAGLIDPWSDGKLTAGDRWRSEIEAALDRAGTAILLVSADFIASEFIADDELPPLLVAAEEKGTRIIPVILKPSRFLRDPNLSRFHTLNDPSRPVIRMDEAEREELYAQLAEIVERDLNEV